MKILALDQALGCTGWGFFENEKLITSGTFSISKTKPIEQRLAEFNKRLTDLLTLGEPDEIVFEDIQNQQNNETYRKLAYIQAVVILWCYYNDFKFSILAPSHWRKILTQEYKVTFGKKREEQKQAAVDFVKDMCGNEVSSDEADAICIGYAYIKEQEKNHTVF